MTAKVVNDYGFEPVGTVDPSAPLVEAVLSTDILEETERPSDTAIMVGCGILGWVVAGPFMAILTALGGKYVADKKHGPLNESTLAIGRITASAGKKAKEEKLLDKFKAGIRSLFGKDENCKNCGSPVNQSGTTTKK